jgi:hypothetical protein
MISVACGLAVAAAASAAVMPWTTKAMRTQASTSRGGWVNPDPNAANLIVWYSFDNSTWTNATQVLSDIPSTTNWIASVVGQQQQNLGTNSLGIVDYSLFLNGAGNQNLLTNGYWDAACAALGTNGWNNGITISLCASNYRPPSLTYQAFVLNTTNASGGPYNYIQFNMSAAAGGMLIRTASNGNVEATFTKAVSTTGEWAHAVITFERNSFKAYYNGVLIGTDTSCGALPGTNAAINASQINGTARYRDIRIYNKVLTSQEVYNAYVAMDITNNLWAKPANVRP